MKQLKTLAIAIVLFIGTQVSAQTKVAHIDVQALMTTMPEMKTAQDQMKKIQETYDKDYKNMVAEYQTKLQKYEQEAPTAGDALNETRSKEMQDMGSRIQQFEQTAKKELGQKEMDLIKPIMEKAQKAIQKVAKAKGVNYVLDATTGSGVLFAEGGIDLLADVKKELGF
ncbi:periplasmic chaperone for outer membrane proteins Skp [Flavobacterium aquaticum]|jgi:outer membrane protein|uniref:Periplasmic chaperone for outer membrane proteins Skp n=1 Tax=Flavobacterium aquaticum TaxID=1236486 RepID=A0A327Z289_9FLAO|nr:MULTISPECIES: OmpH family outer membrane protein [Flavobacterium]MCK6608856.1 OmpH family outer membrane protein [Flavobacterium sp.]RAK24349.1 periplasmic chaperone for outer membrane proteins Skp [Flavobacterium aquaticum]TXI65358.1 MAG: OmpH family outer membrane protein [Flavobacterium sp.]